MWLLFPSFPKPDAVYWSGRRLLAAVDAVAWPGAFALVVWAAPVATGVAGALAIGVAALIAVARLRRAIGRNERYWFTTWRWGKPVFALLLIGGVLKLALPAMG